MLQKLWFQNHTLSRIAHLASPTAHALTDKSPNPGGERTLFVFVSKLFYQRHAEQAAQVRRRKWLSLASRAAGHYNECPVLPPLVSSLSLSRVRACACARRAGRPRSHGDGTRSAARAGLEPGARRARSREVARSLARSRRHDGHSLRLAERRCEALADSG